MSPVTVVDISGLFLGDEAFLHLHLLVDPLPATNSSWARDPGSFWTGFRAISGPICKENVNFKECALVKRVCASTAFPALQVIRITSCLLGPELQLSVCPDRISQACALRFASLQGHKPQWHSRRNTTPRSQQQQGQQHEHCQGAPFAFQGKKDGVSSPQTPRGAGQHPVTTKEKTARVSPSAGAASWAGGLGHTWS